LESRLPKHDQFSLARRLLSGIAITTAGSLIILNVQRLSAVPWSARWLLVPAGLAGMLVADFVSGMVHWAADTWGSSSMPIIGRRLLYPFRVHHLNPDDFLQRKFIDTNGDVALIVIPFLAGGLFIQLSDSLRIAMAAFVTSFAGIGLLTNQIHHWAHQERPPWLIRGLQSMRIILPRQDHALHHQPPYADFYCITTGWCNRPLCAIDFFGKAESMITWITGIAPRREEADLLQIFHALRLDGPPSSPPPRRPSSEAFPHESA
jgi:ubiquitin-conjugating enzyme E2 variant